MIRVIVADSQELICCGAAEAFRDEGDIELAGRAGDGVRALELILEFLPDVAIVGLDLIGLDGIQVLELAASRGYVGHNVVLGQSDDEERMRRVFELGASAYVSKSAPRHELVKAVRAAAQGESYVCSIYSALMVGRFTRKKNREFIVGQAKRLSVREVQVLRFIASGKTTKEIADCLFLSTRTVDFHRHNIMQKLRLHDVATLTHFAVQSGLVPDMEIATRS